MAEAGNDGAPEGHGAEVPPRVCVVGVGALGGVVAGGLLAAGIDVTLVDRSERADHLRERGLSVLDPEGERRTFSDIRVTEDLAEAGPHDMLFLAVKAYDLGAVAPELPSAFAQDAVLVTLQNGIPWWYFQNHGGPLEGRRLRTLDPEGLIERHIDRHRIIGCIPYPAAELLADGTVRHVEGRKLPVGELDGSISPRVRRVAALLETAGFRSRILDDLRSETWLKAWGNLSFNPISALTGATMEALCRFAPTRRLAADMMREAQEVAESLGAHFRVGIERRLEGGEAVGPHKTSMLQDLEAGRRLETEALIGSVVELAEITGKPTPAIRAVDALVRLGEHTRSREKRRPALAGTRQAEELSETNGNSSSSGRNP